MDPNHGDVLLQDIDVTDKLPADYGKVLTSLPKFWAAWTHGLAQYVAGMGPLPRLAFDGEPKADLTNVTAECQQVLLLSALLSRNEESQIAVSALRMLAAADAFLRADQSPQNPAECLESLSGFLQLSDRPKVQIKRIDEEKMLWPQIELLTCHIFKGLLPRLDSLLVKAAMGNLHQNEWEECVRLMLGSVQEALTTTGLKRITPDWALPDNDICCLLLSAQVCNQMRFTAILKRLLVAPMYLRLLASAPDKDFAQAFLAEQCQRMLQAALQEEGRDVLLDLIDAIKHEVCRLVGDVLGHCSCDGSECGCLILSLLRFAMTNL